MITRRPYTEYEEQYIKDNYAVYSATAIANDLDRTPAGIISKAFEIGACTCEVSSYTEYEEQYIRDNFKTMKHKDIATHLRRSTTAIRKKVNRMGLKKQRI